MNIRLFLIIISFLISTTTLFCQSFKLNPATLPNNIITITPLTAGKLPEDPLSGLSNQALEYEWKNTNQYNSVPQGYIYVNRYYIHPALEAYVRADENVGTNNENGISQGLIMVDNDFKVIISNITTNNKVSRVLTQWIMVKDFSQLSIGSYNFTFNYYISN